MSPFASRNLVEHVARGACASLFVALTTWLLQSPDILRGAAAAGCIIGAVVLLRGCPMCWFVGLIETLSASIQKGRHP